MVRLKYAMKAKTWALQVRHGGEVAAAEQLADQDAQPELDLVEPRAVLGRVVEDDAVAGVAQERRPGGHGLEEAGLLLTPRPSGGRPSTSAT